MQGLRIIRGTEAGFSLLEVLVVVGIMSVAAYVAIDAVDRDTSQMRYELTETRLATIRRAIVGDPSLTVNGAPMISGYVADVGQLPPCLEALFQAEAECGATNIAVPEYGNFTADLADGEDPDDDTSGAYIELDGSVGFTSGDFAMFTSGWRGPYITGTLDEFADAWGNGRDGTNYPSRSSVTFIENGWRVSASSDDFEVTSFARDRAFGSDTGDDYGVDQTMSEIVPSDWLVNLAGMEISVEVTNTDPASSVMYQTCVGIVGPDASDPSAWRVFYPTLLAADTDPGPDIQLLPDTTQTLRRTFLNTETLTPGVRTVVSYLPVGTDCVLANQDPVFSATLEAYQRLTFVPKLTPPSVAFPSVSLP